MALVRPEFEEGKEEEPEVMVLILMGPELHVARSPVLEGRKEMERKALEAEWKERTGEVEGMSLGE